MALSGLQKEVIALYRHCLRAARQKPSATQSHFKAYARAEFDKSIMVSKKDFTAIEFLLRKGRRQLDLYSQSSIRDIR